MKLSKNEIIKLDAIFVAIIFSVIIWVSYLVIINTIEQWKTTGP